MAFGFRVQPPVGDRDRDGVAVASVYDTGAGGEVVELGVQHDRGGAAVDGREPV